MSDVAIRVEKLGKRYRIGLKEELHDTLGGALVSWLKSPVENSRRLRKLSTFSDNGEAKDIIWALKDVSFEVKHGEVLGIIGRNGAGKSTLLKILSRITEPTSGRAVANGRVASLLEVGTGFHPELTGRENVYLNGAILGMTKSEIDQKFDEIVAFSEVEKFIDTPVKRYSSGMRVRLAFAVAAHLEPEILLVDEVLAVGDVAFQKKCLGKMGDVSKEGRTVLYVSHNMFSLKNLCVRGILLESGEMLLDSDIHPVIDKYLGSGREQTGEICWDSPDAAPGDERVRLKAVRIVSEGAVTGTVDIAKEFRVEIDYWNLEANGRRSISMHLMNSMSICVFSSGNIPSMSLTPDPWNSSSYPTGLFRTSCIIPACFLNDGLHSVSVFIRNSILKQKEVFIRAVDIISFTAQDTGTIRSEYTGNWIGVVRPRLDWQTMKLK